MPATPGPSRRLLHRIKGRIRRYLRPPPSAPAYLRRNQRSLDGEGLAAVELSIRTNYHKGWRSESSYSPENYRNDLLDHLRLRLEDDRARVIPWLDHVKSLHGSRILELGCGTGSSTVALAEQGAAVTGIDIDQDALLVAKDRCAAYGVKAEFKALNGNQIFNAFGSELFDVIIYFACLEHMTIAERLESLRQAWAMLPAGGLLVIIETPNRLWFHDGHTSFLPFFHWLPNELAFAYSRFSERENFREPYRTYDPTSKMHFLRRGRGMSFHEIALAIAPIRELRILGSLGQFRKSARAVSRDGKRFKSSMRMLFPTVNEAFFDEYLDLIIAKN
jgi:2-polyprenyl-3-methyl-5-hydroxy-6-metoxy-1,4-benzoquinol methylase